MSAHTPGPWVVGREVKSRGSLVYIQIHPESGDQLAVSSVSVYQYDRSGEAVGRRDRLGGVKPTVPSEETRANARLIAAAPDLLEACEAALAVHDHFKETTPTTLKLRAAIAKASGR